LSPDELPDDAVPPPVVPVLPPDPLVPCLVVPRRPGVPVVPPAVVPVPAAVADVGMASPGEARKLSSRASPLRVALAP